MQRDFHHGLLVYSARMSAPVAADVTVQPAARIGGRVRCPGDKSISHRYALLAALADGRTTIAHYAPGADCRSTLACLGQLGVRVDIAPDPDGGLAVEIEGRALGGLCAPEGPLDAGNSGTTVRLLSGILAAQPFTTTLTGDASLRHRPMRRVIDPLTAMGASLSAQADHLPLTITGGALRSIEWTCPVPSAQVKSTVLLAGLHAAGRTTVHEPAATRDHTERALAAFGVDVVRDGLTVSVEGGAALRAASLSVPGDFSAAAAWAVAAAARPGSAIEIDGVGLNPTRTALLAILRRAGAMISADAGPVTAGEPVGCLRVAHRELCPVTITPDEVPSLIDELPMLAALGTCAGCGTTVTGAAELRAKESDRITALVDGLRALGANAEERPDGFSVTGDRPLAGGTADAAGDHRLAMAFAVAALGATGPSTIIGADVVAVSYPGFFEMLTSVRSPE